MILFIFSISLIDFVRFCQSRTFFGNEKMQLFQLFQIYASRGGSCVGKSPPTTPDQIEGDHKQCCPTCSKSIGPFLVRTASQSQRVGSMINMKGTERDRSKASTSSTAQGGGERLVAMNHGWQSKSTDGPKGGWSCVFWSGCDGCSGQLTNNCWM